MYKNDMSSAKILDHCCNLDLCLSIASQATGPLDVTRIY